MPTKTARRLDRKAKEHAQEKAGRLSGVTFAAGAICVLSLFPVVTFIGMPTQALLCWGLLTAGVVLMIISRRSDPKAKTVGSGKRE